MKKWIIYSFGLLLTASLFAGVLEYRYAKSVRTISDHYVRVEQFPKLLTLAQSLPTDGYIEKNSANRINILKVSKDFIEKLYPELENELSNAEKKCLRPSSNKAHVTLKGYLNSPQSYIPAGQRFNFRVNGIFKEIRVRKIHRLKIEETWYEAAVESPQLLKSFKEINHPEILHISIAVAAKLMDSSTCFQNK